MSEIISVCPHNRKSKDHCKECKPCPHGNLKYTCRECCGSAFCEHKKRKSSCIECSGSTFCDHKKIKNTCKECNKCIHRDVHKKYCKECDGSALCEHDTIKTKCKECGGSDVCKHGKRKQTCRECNGSTFCEHNKDKRTCKDCGIGLARCNHGKLKSLCKEHGGRDLCKSLLCETRKNKNYIKFHGYCTFCFVHLFPDELITRNYKTKEKCVTDHIQSLFPNDDWICDKTILDGCSKKRPDCKLDMGSHLLIVEVDENRHSRYDCSCENKRLMQISLDVGHRPIVFLRFNPDGNETSTSCWAVNKKTGILHVPNKKTEEWNNRLKSLTEQIIYWKQNTPLKMVEIIELFY